MGAMLEMELSETSRLLKVIISQMLSKEEMPHFLAVREDRFAERRGEKSSIWLPLRSKLLIDFDFRHFRFAVIVTGSLRGYIHVVCTCTRSEFC